MYVRVLTTFAMFVILIMGCDKKTGVDPTAKQTVRDLTHSTPKTRHSLLSFTYQPPDWSQEAFNATYDFIDSHADMIAHFVDDGVPWPEALKNQKYSDTLENNIQDRVEARRPGQKVLLAVNPVDTSRIKLARYFGEHDNQDLPGEWAKKTWSDKDVAVAYTNYVQRLTRALNPDYLCFAFEVNSNWINSSQSEFETFLSFLKQVRDNLRASFPSLPLVLEVVLGDKDYMKDRWAHTLPLADLADIISISTYPYIFESVASNDASVPEDWFEKLVRRFPNKKLAVQETGFLGDDFTHPKLGTWIPGRGKVLVLGDAKTQAQYVEFLLKQAQEHKFEFVNWWVWKDLDALWKKINKTGFFADPMAAQWNHTGMLDVEGNPRPALKIWKSWYAITLKQQN